MYSCLHLHWSLSLLVFSEQPALLQTQVNRPLSHHDQPQQHTGGESLHHNWRRYHVHTRCIIRRKWWTAINIIPFPACFTCNTAKDAGVKLKQFQALTWTLSIDVSVHYTPSGTEQNKYQYTVKPLIMDPLRSELPLYRGQITCPQLILP